MVIFLNRYLLFAAFVFNFILGLIVYLRNKKNITNITFALFSFNLGLWSLSTGLLYTFPYLFWLNSVIVFFGLSIGSTLNLFVKNFPKPSRSSFLFYFYLISWELFVIAISIFGYHWLFPRYWVENRVPRVIFGLGYQIASILILPYVFSFFYLLYRNYKNSQRIARGQIKYLTLGIAVYIFVIVVLSLLLGSLNIEGFADLSPSFSIFLVGVTTYAIVKHRLWDIRLVLVKSIVFSFIILSLASVYIFIIYFLKDYLSLLFGISPNTTFVIAGLFIALGFAPFKRLIEKVTDNLFYKGRYNPNLLLKRLTEVMRSTLDLETLTNSILSTLKEEMRLERIDLLLIESKSGKVQEKKIFYSSSDPDVHRGNREVLNGEFSLRSNNNEVTVRSDNRELSNSDNKLINLVKQKDILITDELPDPNPDKDLLREKNIACIIPLKVEKKLIGIVCLSEKKSGDMYSLQDINFLLTLSSQLSIACNNALSFDEVVKDREKIKRLLNEREKLDKMKDEFIAIASHEVNTPLTIAQGYLSLILEGTIGKLDKKPRSFLAKAFEGIHRINSLLSALTSASKIGQGKLSANKIRVNLDYLVKESIRTYLPYAKRHHIEIEYQKPKEPLFVLVDPTLIKEVLDHLVSNALKFSPRVKGEVVVSLETKDDKLFVRVKDNGIGIDKEKLPHLFEKFFQADTSFTRAAQGTGLGLYIAQSILKLHKSKIEVKSEEGKGSEFWFGLASSD